MVTLLKEGNYNLTGLIQQIDLGLIYLFRKSEEYKLTIICQGIPEDWQEIEDFGNW
ncbi:hypothetical protein [Pararhodonellum marinum]|uniref:hypothetical protein n=1 Tax=Pararhodonellum marinum TaxID=2755358 RepID=UPI00188DE581|nr:hypothetical protein [Pararhodonellum marinum]